MENTNLKQMIYLEVALFQETSLNVFFPTKPWIGVWNQPRELHKPEGDGDFKGEFKFWWTID